MSEEIPFTRRTSAQMAEMLEEAAQNWPLADAWRLLGAAAQYRQSQRLSMILDRLGELHHLLLQRMPY